MHKATWFAAGGFLAVSVGWVGVNLLGDDDSTGRRLTAVPGVGVDSASSEPATLAVGGSRVAGADLRREDGAAMAGVGGELGARVAAVEWVAALGELITLGPIATGERLGELLTEQAATATADGFRRERQEFVERFGVDPSRALWIESPLAVQVAELAADRAVVLVWSQLITGTADASTVHAVYRTHMVTMLWERDRGRVDDVTRREGPTPQVAPGELPTSGDEFAVVADWIPAVSAGAEMED